MADALGISALLAQCLVNRGVDNTDGARRFLTPRLRDLCDPLLIPNMDRAVERLCIARTRREQLLIFGDYDVDGVTSTALLREVLQALGWIVDFYLPGRFGEGYGLSQLAAEKCLARCPATLLLAVDCGSTSVETVQWLQGQGTDVIILDHHQISDPPPAAVALVNPLGNSHRAGPGVPSANPFTELSSVGLSFKLAHALVKRGRQEQWPEALQFDLRPLLDLVALGTVADLVPLKGENRILVRAGLNHLNAWKRTGLRALRKVASIEGVAGCHEIGFQLAPRLNAAGRLEHAVEALDLLLAADDQSASALAQSLDAKNRERQSIQREIAEEAIASIRSQFQAERDYVIVEGRDNWHIGIVGIVASKVLQEFYRPTLILGREGEEWRGSGRSIEGFDLAEALRFCNQFLLRHGGHAMAAGLSMRPEEVHRFREALNGYAREVLRPELLQPPLRLDSVVTPADLTLAMVAELNQLDPTGPGNPPVQLAMHGVTHQRPPQRMGGQGQHAKFWAGHDGRGIEAVWWNCGEAPLPEMRFDLAFVPQINVYNGNRTVQLKVLDWRPAFG